MPLKKGFISQGLIFLIFTGCSHKEDIALSKPGLDGKLLKKAVFFAAKELNRNKEHLNALNVFPVPDGDTGTNMALTLTAAAKELQNIDTNSASKVAKAVSDGILRGARGNSGVILSQLFRGFARGAEGKSTLYAEDLAVALNKATETAYNAVMKPKEGTILTVAAAISRKTTECAYKTDDIGELVREVIDYGKEVLEQTQYMLPQLKEAGVVDSGAKGLIIILEAAAKVLYSDEEISFEDIIRKEEAPKENFKPEFKTPADIKFTYCTEFMINCEYNFNREERLKGFLASIGDSAAVVTDPDFIKVHIHTNNPGKVLEFALTLGELSDIKIENMRVQHTETLNKKSPEKGEPEIGFVAVATGKGICTVFEEMGANYVIEGGQTMNPSAEDFLNASENLDKDIIIILPNNKNVILAAQQASELCKTKEIHVIPTTTVPQGITALVNYLAFNSLDDNLSNMTRAIENVTTGLVTYAVRDSVVFGKEIKAGDYLCLIENEIVLAADDLQSGTKALIDLMVQKGGELITVYYGQETDDENAFDIQEYIEDKYPEFEVEVHDGVQPLYYYIISVE